MPNIEARINILSSRIKNSKHAINETDFKNLGLMLEGYSASDIFNICKDSAKEPLRRLIKSGVNIKTITADDLGPIEFDDFMTAIRNTKSSVNQETLE